MLEKGAPRDSQNDSEGAWKEMGFRMEAWGMKGINLYLRNGYQIRGVTETCSITRIRQMNAISSFQQPRRLLKIYPHPLSGVRRDIGFSFHKARWLATIYAFSIHPRSERRIDDYDGELSSHRLTPLGMT